MKILLISYSFPPNPVIGSRRWAKLVRELSKKGHEIDVIRAYHPNKNKTQWLQDVEGHVKNEFIVPLNHPYYKFQKSSILNRVFKKLVLITLRLFISGNPLDETILWKKTFRSRLSNILTKGNYDIVIGTGPPFHYLAETARVCTQFPKVKLHIDLRDPWVDGFVYFTELSPAEKRYETKLLTETLSVADLTTATDQALFDQLDFLSILPKKRAVVPHFYDPSELPNSSINKKESEFIRFIFGGSLIMNDHASYSKGFISVLNIIKQHHPSIYSRLKFDFYSNSHWFENIIRNSGHDVVRFLKPIPAKEYFIKMERDYDYQLSFINTPLKDYLLTKVAISSGLNTPIVQLGPEGTSNDRIRIEIGGFAMGSDHLIDFIKELPKTRNKKVAKYSLEENANKLDKLLRSMACSKLSAE